MDEETEVIIITYSRSLHGDVNNLVNIADEHGQLGLGSNGHKKHYTLPMICCFNVQLIMVSCGRNHSAILSATGQVYMMGSNKLMQLGIKGGDQNAPMLIEQLSKLKCIQISCGDNHTAAVMTNGHLYTWGENLNSQLGKKSKEISRVDITNIAQVSCGAQHTLVLDKFGDPSGFGVIISGRVPQCKQVAAGKTFSLFLSTEGLVYACGEPYSDTVQLIHKCMKIIPIQEKFVKIAAWNQIAGLTASREFVLFDGYKLSNIDDFALGESYSIAVGDKNYLLGEEPKIIEQLQNKSIFSVSAGGGHIMALGTQRKVKIDHSISERPSNMSEVQQLKQKLQDKEKSIQLLKLEHKTNIEIIEKKYQELLKIKDRQIQELQDQLIEKKTLKCQMKMDISALSPIKNMDSLPAESLRKPESKQTRYSSHEAFKITEFENHRPSSQSRTRPSHESSLTNIKIKLTDLQKNKVALEERMKLFEDRIKNK